MLAKKNALQISQQVTRLGKVTLSFTLNISELPVNLRCQKKTGEKRFPLSPLGVLVGRTQYRIKALLRLRDEKQKTELMVTEGWITTEAG